MYVSVMLDNIEKRHPQCTQHAAGVAKLIQKTAHVAMGHPLQILTTHSVVAYVNSQTLTLTSLRQQRLSKILEHPTYSTHMKESTWQIEWGWESHTCTEQVLKSGQIYRQKRSVKKGTCTQMVYCFRDEQEGLKAAYAEVEEDQKRFVVRKALRLTGPQSAQRAEIMTVIEALKLAEGQKVNIYTDSGYAAGAVHVELGQWLRAGLLTASNKPNKHRAEMRELAEALLLPAQVAVIKCKGHDTAVKLRFSLPHHMFLPVPPVSSAAPCCSLLGCRC